MSALIPCVLCGGVGSRLWPASRVALPKPFAPLPGRNSALIDGAYARLVGLSPTAVVTVTAAENAFLCEAAYARNGIRAPHILIGEPCGRDTAAAIGYATTVARARFGGDAILVFLPADNDIANADAFHRAIVAAADAAANGAIALLGIRPTYAATGYGYIECADYAPDKSIFAVRRFLEKPDLATANALRQRDDVFWNGGVFCFAADTGLRELRKQAPAIAAALPSPTNEDRVFPSSQDYANIPPISFDYAVAEKTDIAVVVVAEGLGWSDVGSWRVLAENLPPDSAGNRVIGDARLSECADVFVAANGNRLVVGVGLNDALIVDAPDALLVAAADKSEKVRAVAESLLADGRREATTPTTTQKPWGSYTVLATGEGYLVKRIDVSPGGQLSLQSHRHRSEHWTTITGEIRVVIEGREFDMPVDRSCHIPVGAKHRMQNNTDAPAAVIEVQCGSPLDEADIIRHEDKYGRANSAKKS